MKRFSILLSFLILISFFVPVSAIGFDAVIENVPGNLTTTHDVPFDEMFTINNPVGDPISNVGAVDENDNPIGTVTFTPGELSFQWTFNPSCAWVTDGLTHTVSFYLEDATGGHLYPEVIFYTSTLIVTAGEAPEISGNCMWPIVTAVLHSLTAEFEVTNQSEEDIYWSYFVSPSAPIGNVKLIDGVFTFSPCPADDGMDFQFTIMATDCAGQYGACDVNVDVISGCMLIFHDPNYDGDIDILDIVLLINNVYKGGPAPMHPPSGDWNLDETIDILDIVYIINFVYKDGPYPIHAPLDC
ncbi:MAG: hypothetical protein GY865_01925 [candidate division Zixibacteria bacterium]|nr:hypothetical protein [candidate division Zixibacteria bacterium]